MNTFTAKESIVTFGRLDHLTGILTPACREHGDIVIMLLNAGAVHKVGPFGLNVHIARYLSDCGIAAFRFDLSGLGESEKSDQAADYDKMVQDDIHDAIDLLVDTHGYGKVIVAGLCTGADLAYKAAFRDDRVKGIICIDGYGYRTPGYYFRRYGNHFRKPRKLLKALYRKFLSRVCTGIEVIADSRQDQLWSIDADTDYYWYPPARERFRQSMAALARRPEFCALLIYSGGVRDYFNYERQMHDAFRGDAWLRTIQVVYLPQSSHTFSIDRDRKQLLGILQSWMQASFPRIAPP